MIGIAKKKSITNLDKVLWKVFSEYIRRRDAVKFSGSDRVKCITCEFVGHWKYDFDAGHFMSRKHLGTKFHEMNVHAQCGGCNKFGQGKQYAYAKVIDRLYGNGTADLLEQKSRTACKWMSFEYEQKIEEYKQKIKEL